MVAVALASIAGCGRNSAPSAAAETPAAPKTAPTPADAAKETAAKAAAAKKLVDAEKEKARQAAAEAVPVEMAPVTRGPISSFLAFNSTLETEATVDIFPQASGQVEELFAEEGKIVKLGDPLLKIDDSELRVDAEESQTNYNHEQLAFARNEGLFNQHLITNRISTTSGSPSTK